jgi:hypothetical protein
MTVPGWAPFASPSSEDERIADWAASGVLALTGRPDGPPLLPPGHAATAARRLGEVIVELSGGRVRVDGAALLAERAAFTGGVRHGQVSVGGATRLLPAVDGHVALTCALADDVARLGALVEREIDLDPWPVVMAWLTSHTGQEFAERAELLGIAGAAVPTSPSPSAAPLLEKPRDVTGLRVVDFSALWAGPLCANLLGLAGARVIKVETPHRPDGARRGNRPFYEVLHGGHRSVVVDPGTPDGRASLRRLVGSADIVIEASRPRALAGFGLDARAYADSGVTWISITAGGRSSNRVGLGDDIAAGAGLVAWADQLTPVFVGDAIADPLTGLTAAALAMIAPTGPGGRLWDICMTDVVAATLARGPAVPSTTAHWDTGRWWIGTAGASHPVLAPRRRAPAAPHPSAT